MAFKRENFQTILKKYWKSQWNLPDDVGILFSQVRRIRPTSLHVWLSIVMSSYTVMYQLIRNKYASNFASLQSLQPWGLRCTLLHWYLDFCFVLRYIGGSRGGAPGARPPYGSRFFCFDMQNFRNVATSGVPRPPVRGPRPPPTGNSGSATAIYFDIITIVSENMQIQNVNQFNIVFNMYKKISVRMVHRIPPNCNTGAQTNFYWGAIT